MSLNLFSVKISILVAFSVYLDVQNDIDLVQ